MITEAQRRDYERDGFLVLEGFAPRAECEALIARAKDLVSAFDPAEAPRSVFTTREQVRASDEYFLGSGGEVRFFFEEDAFAPDGALRQPKERSINKIGHALHDLDPAFERFSRAPALAALARDVGMREPVLIQSMYIFKQPFIGGEVDAHQDHTFLWTDPPSVTGFWFALEDATTENGCMWALPGGHRIPVRKRFKRAASGAGTAFDVMDPEPLPTEGMVPLKARAGTCVVLHGLLPHRSGPNRSPRSRHAYALHAIERGASYPESNWLRRPPGMPLRGF